ncbi:MAG: hypothetical protein U0559_01135 [Anaerolineae bacterium]
MKKVEVQGLDLRRTIYVARNTRTLLPHMASLRNFVEQQRERKWRRHLAKVSGLVQPLSATV